MSKKAAPMGSPLWAEQTFLSPPVRKLKGHSRRTQYHQFWSAELNQIIGVQGRNELCSALAIEYLMRLGLLARAKPQPFITPRDDFGSTICPDFLVEELGKKPNLIVIETKSSRFLTRVKHLELEHIREKFAGYGIRYLVWTDQTPLNHAVRHHLINMRGAANRYVTDADKLLAWIVSQSAPTLTGLYSAGFDLDSLYATAWSGKVFFPLTKPLHAGTPLSTHPQEDMGAIFLGCTNGIEDWWTQLPAC